MDFRDCLLKLFTEVLASSSGVMYVSCSEIGHAYLVGVNGNDNIKNCS